MDLATCFIELSSQTNMAEVPKVPLYGTFGSFLILLLLCCLDDLLIDFRLIYDGFCGRKSTNNPSKIDQRSDQKSNAILDGSWSDFEAIFVPSWGQVGTNIRKLRGPR